MRPERCLRHTLQRPDFQGRRDHLSHPRRPLSSRAAEFGRGRRRQRLASRWRRSMPPPRPLARRPARHLSRRRR
jgi:hypothetical protein